MSEPKKISLGLQGGGSYGAFGWGVLDRLLDDGRLEIDAISATSAGAINAVALADGYAHEGGPQGARRSLEKFWNALGQAAMLGPLRPTPMDALLGRGSIETSPGYLMLQLATATISPVQLGPLSVNPLSALLGSLVDFERVRACAVLRLFISATNVRTGKGRIFRREELDVTKVMASAALPQVFAPVRIEGEAYWDGSFVGNPPLGPLVDEAQAGDILLVQNNPVARRNLPLSMADVNNRVNEIAFNISLVQEIGAIQHTATVIDEEGNARVHRNPVRLHLISGAEALHDLSLSSKFNMDWNFIRQMHELGHAAADRWMHGHFHQLGTQSTLKLEQLYAAPPR